MIRLQEVELDFGHTEDGRQTDGWTDRRGSRNSYLDTIFQEIWRTFDIED